MLLKEYSRYPIIQAPMAGGATTPELVAAVSNAGALGSLAAPLLPPQAILEQSDKIRALTGQPFAINLFVQSKPEPSADTLVQASELLKPIWQALGWDALPAPVKWCEDFAAQLDALVMARPAMASFTFGILTTQQVDRLHAASIFVVGTATNVDEAMAWQAVGADAVCAQGIEAGGHRGTFIGCKSRTGLTRAFSGRYARGLVNRFIETMQPLEDKVPAYPIQNALTGSIRAHAGKTGDIETMSLWAGQGVAAIRSMPAAELVQTLVAELQQAQDK